MALACCCGGACYVPFAVPSPPRSMVSEALGVVLPSTILFDYPSIEALCGYILATQVGGVWQCVCVCVGGWVWVGGRCVCVLEVAS